MILPIVLYGDPVLKTTAHPVAIDMEEIKNLVKDLFDTMSFAEGIGLAAPQIGKSMRLFVVDTTPMEKEKTFKQVFINPEIVEEIGEPWLFEEGCLSIPGVRERISRKPTIKIRYLDENLDKQEQTFDGMVARVIQHEYDHLKGRLLTDYLTPFKKKILKNKLNNIRKGNVDVKYPIKPQAKKR